MHMMEKENLARSVDIWQILVLKLQEKLIEKLIELFGNFLINFFPWFIFF